MNRSCLDVNVDGVGVPDPVVVDVGDGDEVVVKKAWNGPVESKQTNERKFTRARNQQLALYRWPACSAGVTGPSLSLETSFGQLLFSSKTFN